MSDVIFACCPEQFDWLNFWALLLQNEFNPKIINIIEGNDDTNNDNTAMSRVWRIIPGWLQQSLLLNNNNDNKNNNNNRKNQ